MSSFIKTVLEISLEGIKEVILQCSEHYVPLILNYFIFIQLHLEINHVLHSPHTIMKVEFEPRCSFAKSKLVVTVQRPITFLPPLPSLHVFEWSVSGSRLVSGIRRYREGRMRIKQECASKNCGTKRTNGETFSRRSDFSSSQETLEMKQRERWREE